METSGKKVGTKIEVHLIQNFAPSNLNRDDVGQPKSAYFGGVRRARISSQCFKRAIRNYWNQNNTIKSGLRSKRLVELILKKLNRDPDDEADKKIVGAVVAALYSKIATDKKKEGEKGKAHTEVLVFISPSEVDCLIAAIEEHRDELTKLFVDGAKNKKDIPAIPKELVKSIAEKLDREPITADISLFGRMLADNPTRGIDAACQVAHSISTSRADMESDFFTAVDDLNPREETGAGMMGDIGFNSACHYRYALIDRDQLARNMSRKLARKRDGSWKEELVVDDYVASDDVIKALLDAMLRALPTGKQNSFAAHNLPAFGLFVVRRGGVPLSLVNAFAKPVHVMGDQDDLIGESVARLTKRWDDLTRAYGSEGVVSTALFHVDCADKLNELKTSECASAAEAIEKTMEAIGK